MVRGFIAWLFDDKAQGRTNALGTVRNHVAALRALLATAVEDGVLRHNPATGVRISSTRPTFTKDASAQRRALHGDELTRFLTAVPEEWRLFFELLTHTGMRVGEALELRWGDIDLGRKRVMVRRQIRRGVVSEPKSRFGKRDIPLSTAMSRRLWGPRGDPAALVFTDHLGRPLTDHWLRHNVLDKAAAASGLGWVGFHSFRHTCASLLFAGGKNVKQVQEWLGHSDPGFTLRTYVHLIDDGLGDAEFLDGATSTLRDDAAEAHPVHPAEEAAVDHRSGAR